MRQRSLYRRLLKPNGFFLLQRFGMTGLARANPNCRAIRHCRSLVAEHSLCRRYTSDQALCDRTVVCFASSQEDGEEASFSICKCMDLRVAAASRATNSLFLLPPLSPRRRAMRFNMRRVDHLRSDIRHSRRPILYATPTGFNLR